MKKHINLLREFSIPLLAGVFTALVWANINPQEYQSFISSPLLGGVNLHFVVNELFMVLFFGIAAVEITQSCLPGGDLNPPRKAINPLLSTLGGVVGPVVVYLGLNAVAGDSALTRGWGIPTATDIALAWLVARMVFGAGHPAVSFLLLLAVADDAIGLAIIAIFYPDPSHPVEPLWLFLTVAAIVIAYILRSAKVKNYWPYVILGGGLSWTGLFNAHLHPALALVFIIPFLPHPPRESVHLFEDDPRDTSTLASFEHDWKIVVDFGLFLFGLANAGVGFSTMGTATWLVLAALVVGKTAGIFAMGTMGKYLGFPLPDKVGKKELLLTGLVAGTGLTVALFVAGVAFVEPDIQGSAKMGALLSGGVALVAVILGRALNVRRIP